MTTTSSIPIVRDLCFLPGQSRRRISKSHRNRRPAAHRRSLHPSSSCLPYHITPLWMRNPPNRVTGRQSLLRLLPFGTSFVLPSRGKDQKVALPISMDTFSHLLAIIGSRCPTVCLQTHNDHCTFSQKRTGGLLLLIRWTASIPHPPINPLTL